MAHTFRSSRFAVLIGAFLVLAIALSSAMSLWIARQQSIEEWRKQLSNLSLILADQTSHELTAAYLVLDSIVENIQQANVKTAADLRTKMASAEVYASLRDATRSIPQIDVATIVAANGDVINFTRSYPAPAINLAERDYFRQQANSANGGVFISQSVRNKGNNQWTFYLSKRLEGAHGEFIGLALVGLSTSAFSEFFRKISLGKGATVTLYRRDFTVLARWPHDENLMGKVNRNGSSYTVIEKLGKTNDVILISSPRFSDAGRRVFRMGAPRLVDKYPLIVNITVTEDLFLAQWHRWAVLIVAMACASIGAVTISFWLLVNSMRRSEISLELTERLKQEAEASNRAKSDFLTMMSHEIRTPLTAINGFAELLSAESDNAETRDRGRIILNNGQHLLGIINDILDLSKIEADRLEIEHIAFSPLEIASDIDSIMRAQAHAREVAFELRIDYPQPAQVLGDPTCWRQILFNLCSNAIKFTERGSVELAMRYDTAQSMFAFRVTDTGIGISEEQLNNLFKPFSQADRSISRKYGGTGLGLYLVDRLARRMGGSVTARSELGKGSTFEVLLPAHLPEDARWIDGPEALPAAPAVPDSEPAPALQGRVLLAEDGCDNRKLVRALLSRLGLDCSVTDNGAQALDLARREKFDAILMDIQMPVMDGIEATRSLRSLGFRIPVIALTANVMAEDVRRYREAGFTDCVSKPIDFGELTRCLSSILAPSAEQAIADSMSDFPEFLEIRKSFEQGLPDSLAQLEAYLETEQGSAVIEAAHSLKGTAGSFGYARVTALAGEIESAARAASFARARAAMQALWNLDEVRRLLEAC